MMPPFLLPVLGFLKGLPWQVYVAAAFIALLPLSYCKGKSDGKAVVYAKLEAAEKKAAEKAEKAAAKADGEQAEKTEQFEVEQETLRKAIDDAKATDSNALDSIFN